MNTLNFIILQRNNGEAKSRKRRRTLIWASIWTQPPLISICKTKIIWRICVSAKTSNKYLLKQTHKFWRRLSISAPSSRWWKRFSWMWNFKALSLKFRMGCFSSNNFFQNQKFDGILFPFSNKCLKNWTYVRQIEGSFEIQIFLPFPCLEWIYGLQFVTCKNKFTWLQLELL